MTQQAVRGRRRPSPMAITATPTRAPLATEALEAEVAQAPVRRPSLVSRLSRDASAWAYGSTAVVVLGFGVLAFTWGRVAGEVQLHRQLPLLVSGGLTGLALVFMGTAALVVHAWRTESDRQRREIQRIRAAMARRSTAPGEG